MLLLQPILKALLGISARIPWQTDKIKLHVMGRYIFLKGNLNKCVITLIGVYAPNNNQRAFWDEVIQNAYLDTSYAMILGDFNSVSTADLNILDHLLSLITCKHFLINMVW